MKIESLYKTYFQKSKIFLYPLLGIDRDSSINPIQTYVSWEGKIQAHDKKLVCLYHLRDDREYRLFEQTKIKNNKLFDQLIHTEDNKVAYLFDLSKYDKDWRNFRNGRYSKLSPELKGKIKGFFRTSGNHFVYAESFVHPDKYFAIYSELLGVSIERLREVGELCDPPDLERETLIIQTKKIQIEV